MRRLVAHCLLAAACGGAPSSAPMPNMPSSTAEASGPSRLKLGAASCARARADVLPARVSASGQGSAVALVRSGERLLAYVADADSRSLHTVSVDDRRELGRTRLDGAPQQLVVFADGRVAVTLTDTASVVLLEPSRDPSAPMTTLCERDTPAEPWGIALAPEDSKVVVSSAWAATLTVPGWQDRSNRAAWSRCHGTRGASSSMSTASPSSRTSWVPK